MSETVPGHAELVAELAELEAANEAADGWGAAVGARQERINSIRRTLSALRPDEAAGLGDAVLCSDCPPVGYSTDRTRCIPCPRHADTITTLRAELAAVKRERDEMIPMWADR